MQNAQKSSRIKITVEICNQYIYNEKQFKMNEIMKEI